MNEQKDYKNTSTPFETSKDYDFKAIETKWQKKWEKNPPKAKDFSDRNKHYHLVEFPYPSGSGLHVGHCMGYSASDAYVRMKRMQGNNVLFPIGWDAFGLPTENYAIKTGRKPQDVTKENINTYRKQMKKMGFSFDWNREVNTTDPDYYKWTQWIFLQFYKHGIIDNKLVELKDDDATTPRLAYQSEMPINWCPSCKIGLANEEVINGKCERCGATVEKRMQKQWMLRITAYADKLIDDLKTVDYEEKIKTQQTNWIGRSVGTNIKFKVIASEAKQSNEIATPPAAPRNDTIEVFTTRADTLFGCTYVVLSPEHPLINNLQFSISNFQEVKDYQEQAKKKSDLERTELQKDKTGIELKGIKAVNPINNEEVSVWVADYVLANYGTGAVMAVPAHDDRDWEFAKKYNIPIRQSISLLHKTESGPDAVKADKETIKRKTVLSIIKHWEHDQYYCLDWEKFGWKSFVIGGVEDDESYEDAAKREAIEESGYKNIKSIKKVGFTSNDFFYAIHKGVNRYAITEAYLIELEDGAHEEPAEEHTKNHKGLWVESKEVNNFINLPNNQYYWDVIQNGEKAFTDYGVLMNSGEFSGLSSKEGKEKITEKLKELNAGDFSVNFKLRDWVFSRQHYWGEPIPIIYCANCAKTKRNNQDTRNNNQTKNTIVTIGDKEYMLVPLPESELPLTLPEVENYKPTNNGESPLSVISEWVNTTCPKCGGKAKRETDTMPNWAGSSWYYLAYAMNSESRIMNYANEENIFINAKKELDYWLPVDIYNGGNEHTTLHLLYSRFWHKFLYDIGSVPCPEPYQARINHGIILGPDGQKMSKSKGNVVNPDEVVDQYGADCLRAYIMFIGPYDQESAWSTSGIQGVFRFLGRVYSNKSKVDDAEDDKELLIKLNRSIEGITKDIESFHFNTVVSKLMELNNSIEKTGHISKKSYKSFLRLLFPVAPHLASELYESIFDKIDDLDWPEIDSKYLLNDSVEIVVQVNGKIRDKLQVSTSISEEELKEKVLSLEKVQSNIDGKPIKKVIVVPKKLVSIVVTD